MGSDDVESGHRHVIQQRLTLTDRRWWKENNAEAMPGLRVAGANQPWISCWNHSQSIFNCTPFTDRSRWERA